MCKEMGIQLIVIPYNLTADALLVEFIYGKLRELGIKMTIDNIREFQLRCFYKNSSKLKELREIAEQRGGDCSPMSI